MCLYINLKFHLKDIFAQPISNKKDILVYKILDVGNGYKGTYFRTPYTNFPITFKRGKSILYGNEHKKNNISVDCLTVSVGAIHSLIYKYEFSLSCGKVFYAIIPSETKHFVGMDHDIASSKLIIFKNIFYYWKYCLFHGFPIKAEELYGG